MKVTWTSGRNKQTRLSPSLQVDGVAGQMRARSVAGSVVSAWVVPAPRLPMETSQPAVHALGRRRALPRSARAPSSPATDVTGEDNCMFGRNRSRQMSTSLRAGVQVGEGGRFDEASPHKHDDETTDARIYLPGVGTAAVENAVGSKGERVEKKERVWHRLSPMQVQQQALIRRLRTLEARRDWRGVLAAMVRDEPEEAHQSAVVELRDTV